MMKFSLTLAVIVCSWSMGLCAVLECTKIGACKCEMSDGSGVVSLEGINLNADNSPRWAIVDNDFTYYFNPCKAFKTETLNDLAVLQKSFYFEEYDLGVQTSESFHYTEAKGLYINYKAAVDNRTSRISLICNKQLPFHRFFFVGELTIMEYDFILEGPCACPGGCDSNGVIVSSNTNSETSYSVNILGKDLASLFIHDIILVFIIVCVYFIGLYFGYQWTNKKQDNKPIDNVNYVSNA